MRPLFLSLAGPDLSREESAFFRAADPAGYILFARNIDTPERLSALTQALRDLHGRADLPILIDQEGGRVARMKHPHWPAFPAAATFAHLYDKAPLTALEAARLNARALGVMLKNVGINVNCMPMLDVRQPDSDPIVGDRSYGSDANSVAALGSASLQGLRQSGVIGVIKHCPGHGRATADSHKTLPVVTASREELENTDIVPFRKLRDAPMVMTAHIVYPALDPDRPATLSPIVIKDVIRKAIGIDGLIMSDDLAMHALTGTPAARARAALDAGCDIGLYCSGILDEMRDLVAAIPDEMPQESSARLTRACAWPDADHGADADLSALIAQRDMLVAAAHEQEA